MKIVLDGKEYEMDEDADLKISEDLEGELKRTAGLIATSVHLTLQVMTMASVTSLSSSGITKPLSSTTMTTLPRSSLMM